MRPSKIIFIVMLILVSIGFANTGNAQDNDDNTNISKIQTQRVAFFTEKLNLSPAEAEKFWPIYNEYDAKRAKLTAEETRIINTFKENKTNISDNEIDINIKKIFDTRKSIIGLNEEYYKKFRQVLPARKVMKLIITETQFRIWLLNKLRPAK